MTRKRSFTVCVDGDVVRQAKEAGYHAYVNFNVTAIEVTAENKTKARKITRGVTTTKTIGITEERPYEPCCKCPHDMLPIFCDCDCHTQAYIRERDS